MRSAWFASGVAVVAAVGVLACSATARPASSPISIVSVRAVPPPPQRGGGLLTPGKLNVVFSAGVATLQVELRNSGTSTQTHVAVKVVIGRRGGAIAKTETLNSVRSGQTATVTLRDLGKVPLALPTNVTVEVLGGQTRVYSVAFVSPD